MNVSTLRLADEPKLREWMLSFITDHIKWWNSFYKVSWTDEQIDHHIDKNELIHKSIDRLLKAKDGEQDFIRVLRETDRICGIVYANVKTDNFVAFNTGYLQWIWIDPKYRGQGHAKQLIKVALKWLSDKDIQGAQLFVNKKNRSAISLYKSLGFKVSDNQMIMPKGLVGI